MMTPDELATRLDRTRNRVREIQRAIYRTGMAGPYHLGKARDMLADPQRAQALTGLHDVTGHLLQLPAVIERIEELDARANAAWSEGGDALASIVAMLSEACDAVRLRPRGYERLVRQSDKPIIARAVQARDLAANHPRRLGLERILRLPVDDYLRLEEQIQATLTTIDSDRDAIALAYRELADAYVRAAGYRDEVSLAAGRLGTRLAVNMFDERPGYDFMEYAGPWIDRELERVGSVRKT
jgi:hypothetical protein